MLLAPLRFRAFYINTHDRPITMHLIFFFILAVFGLTLPPAEYPEERYSANGDILTNTFIPGVKHTDRGCRRIFVAWAMQHPLADDRWPVTSGDAHVPVLNGIFIRFWCYNIRRELGPGEARKRGSFTIKCGNDEVPMTNSDHPIADTDQIFGHPHVFGYCALKVEEKVITTAPTEIKCTDMRTPLIKADTKVTAQLLDSRGSRRVQGMVLLFDMISGCMGCEPEVKAYNSMATMQAIGHRVYRACAWAKSEAQLHLAVVAAAAASRSFP